MTPSNTDTPSPTGGTAMDDLLGFFADVKANPAANPYPHRAVHDRMAYDWYCWSGAAKYELAGNPKAWLAGACRERGIAASKMTRKQMIDALVTWQTDAETKAGWTSTPDAQTDTPGANP